MTEHEPSSPRIFAPSSLIIDDSKLCFNKNHFSRTDFDVQRFMNLARRRAGLEQIQKDLRLYLKSIQHSMIELINDDYADFVHLSSNLVGLQSGIDKIEKDIENIWMEFEQSTAESVGTAEQIEFRCDQLTYNRKRQAETRDKVAFLSALQRLQTLLKTNNSSVIWLEKVASCIVDLTMYVNIKDLDESSIERKVYNKELSKLETVLCKEGVQSASSDCFTLPHVLSVLSLTKSSHMLTAAIITDFLHPKLVSTIENHDELLTYVLNGVSLIRDEWKKILAKRFSGNLKTFLDQTLLTFIITFLEKCLPMVIVPNDTRIFQKCYQTIDTFIKQWPNVSSSNIILLKSIRDKFNFLVYFKLITFKISKQVESLCSSDIIACTEGDEKMKCSVSAAIHHSIENIWSEEVFLFPLIEKFWDYTLKLLSKHYAWASRMSHLLKTTDLHDHEIPKWKCIINIRSDLKLLYSTVFDLCLEQIWTKLRDLKMETSLFGQCLTRHGQRIDKECSELDRCLLEISAKTVEEDLEAASEIPKHYRWTRKPAPTSPSTYALSALEKIAQIEKTLQDADIDPEEFVVDVTKISLVSLIDKLSKVLEGTEMHNASRLLVSRKSAVTATEGPTDNDKIKTQIYHDLKACSEFVVERNIEIEGLATLLNRCRPDDHSSISTQRGDPTYIDDSKAIVESVESNDSNGKSFKKVHNEPGQLREGSA